MSVLALCFLMKLEGIVREMLDDDYISSQSITHQFNEPWNWSNHPLCSVYTASGNNVTMVSESR